MLKKHNLGAYASLPTQVPLSANPKPSPYTDKTVDSAYHISHNQIRILYTDGSTEDIYFKGEGPFC